MARNCTTGLFLLLTGTLGVTGCTEFGQLPFNIANRNATNLEADAATGSVSSEPTYVEQDVEAPDVFAVNESGLWDGRPSLGGVWVAHPDVADPERVLIKNEANGKTVVGALFRRERENPGPSVQVSSDAAAELGMLAGQPTSLDIVALRREEVEVEPPAPVPGAVVSNEAIGLGPSNTGIEASSLDTVATAAAAIERADGAPAEAVEIASASGDVIVPTVSVDAPVIEVPRISDLDEPYLQIGIFSVEDNATKAANSLREAGLIPTVRGQSSNGNEFWRVLVGPATNEIEQGELLATIKGLGYADAYAVTD